MIINFMITSTIYNKETGGVKIAGANPTELVEQKHFSETTAWAEKSNRKRWNQYPGR